MGRLFGQGFKTDSGHHQVLGFSKLDDLVFQIQFAIEKFDQIGAGMRRQQLWKTRFRSIEQHCSPIRARLLLQDKTGQVWGTLRCNVPRNWATFSLELWQGSPSEYQ